MPFVNGYNVHKEGQEERKIQKEIVEVESLRKRLTTNVMVMKTGVV